MITNRAEPILTRPYILIPAVLPDFSHSNPTKTLKNKAINSFTECTPYSLIMTSITKSIFDITP